jgi:hypothetical protein
MRPKSHVIGDIGHAAVALIFKTWGWTASVVASDYGEDLDCQVFIDHQRTPLHFRCQVKASENLSELSRTSAGDAFNMRISGALCREWLLSYFPVLLVLYDCKTGTAYWVNATEELRTGLQRLTAKSFGFRVPATNCLAEGRDEVTAQLFRHYAQLLKIESEGVERTVFPILMPRYRALSIWDQTLSMPEVRSETLAVRTTHVSRDDMPTWTTGIRTLQPGMLSGFVVSASHADAAAFTDSLFKLLSDAFPATRLESSEWISFICDPLRYTIEGDVDSHTNLQQQLSDWTSYAWIGDRLVSDHEHAFRPPRGFLSQTGRRARSWDGYYHVSTRDDLAVRLLAGTCPTPTDFERSRSLKEHAEGQYFPWQCRISEVDELQTVLSEIELIFQPLDESDKPSREGWSLGAICTPMFDPSIGLFPQANGWRELELGSVRQRLEKSGMISLLPGKPGSARLSARLSRSLAALEREPPTLHLVELPQARSGLPLDLTERRLIVHRLRRRVVRAPIDDTSLKVLEAHLATLSMPGSEIEVTVSHMDGGFDDVTTATASWTPLLADSSAESLERALAAIVKAFDAIMPRIDDGDEFGCSINVLRFLGELYFEGDRLI